MERLFIRFDQRDFSKPLPAPRLRYEVDTMTWSANGGPEEAEITALGNIAALNILPQLLRAPVTVTDRYGGAMWWGFVNAVEIHLGGLVYTASLEGMANRVAVRWSQEDPVGGAAQRWDYQTNYSNDLTSQVQYGIKSAVFDLGEGRQADAEAARATYLARLKVPQTKSVPGEGLERPYGMLKLRGWFGSLDWRFYAQNRGYVGDLEWGNGGINYPFGQAAGTSMVEQRVTANGYANWNAQYAWMKIYKVGSPSDNLICELMTAASSGVIATATIAGSTIAHDSSNYTIFDFITPASLTPTTNYYLRLSRSGSVDASNYYGVKIIEDGLLGANQFYYWNGSIWTSRSPNSSAILAIYGVEETTQQMNEIVKAVGQFFSGCVIRDASGVNTRMYRAGKLDALEEMLGLLAVGDSAGNKMDAWVSADRWLVVRKRPVATDPTLMVTPSGEVRYRNGRALIGSDLPVGRWARVESLVQMGGDYGAKSVVFLSRAEWRDGKVKVWWE